MSFIHIYKKTCYNSPLSTILHPNPILIHMYTTTASLILILILILIQFLIHPCPPYIWRC